MRVVAVARCRAGRRTRTTPNFLKILNERLQPFGHADLVRWRARQHATTATRIQSRWRGCREVAGYRWYQQTTKNVKIESTACIQTQWRGWVLTFRKCNAQRAAELL